MRVLWLLFDRRPAFSVLPSPESPDAHDAQVEVKKSFRTLLEETPGAVSLGKHTGRPT